MVSGTIADSVLEAFRQTSLGKQGSTVDADGRENARRATKASSTARLASETKKKRAEAQRRREEDRDKAKTHMEKEVRRRRAEDAKIAELALRAEEDARLADAREALTAAVLDASVRRADAAAKLERFHVYSDQYDADLSRLPSSPEEGARAALAALVAAIDERRAACALAVEVSDADTSAEAAKKRRAAEDARRAKADDWYEDSLGFFRASYTEIARRRARADATLKAALDAKMAALDPEEAARDDAAAMGSDSERAANDATTTTTTWCESRERLVGGGTRMEADRRARQDRRRAEAEDAMRLQMAQEDARRCDEDMFLWNRVEGSLRFMAAAATRLQEAEAEILACAEGASEQMVTAESICSETEDTRRVAAQRDVDDTETSTPMLRTPAPESYESKVKSLATKLLDGPLRGLKMPGTQNQVRNDVVESIIATCFARFEPGFAEIIFNSHKTGQEVPLKTLRRHLRLVGAAAERALDAFTTRRFCVYYFEAEIGRDADISFGARYLAFEAFLKESDECTSAKYTGKAASMTPWERALQHLDLRLSGTAVWKDVLADLKEDLEKGITWRLTLTLLLDDFDVDALARKFKFNMSPTCTLSETVLMATVRSVSGDALGGFGTNIQDGVGGKQKNELGATPEAFDVYNLLYELEGEEGMTVAEIADKCVLTPGSVNYLMARHGGDDGLFFGFGTRPIKWRIRRNDDEGAAPAMDSKTSVQKLLSTLEGEEGMTVAEIADKCVLTPGSVNYLMARHGGDDGLFFGFGTRPIKWRIRRNDDEGAAPAMDSKTSVQKLLSTLEGEEGMTVAEIADKCVLTPGSVNYLMARHGGDDGLFFGFGTRPIKWRIRRNDDEGAAPAMDSKTSVQKLLSTLEGEEGMTVAEIADKCVLTLDSVQKVMARHGGDDGLFFGFGTRPIKWRIRRNDDEGAAPAMDSKTSVQKLLSTLEGEEGMTVAEIADKCVLTLDSVHQLMARYGGDDGLFFGFGTRPIKWRIRRNDDEGAAPAMDSKTSVQKLLSTLEGEEGMTVAEIADKCVLTLGSVHYLMARHGGDDGLFFGFGTRPIKWRIRRNDDEGAAPAMDSKTLVQKLLSTLEGEDGMTVAEIADKCVLTLDSVKYLMARYGGDDGLFFGFGTRPIKWRIRRNDDEGAAPAKDKKRDRSEDGRDDDANAALPKRKKS